MGAATRLATFNPDEGDEHPDLLDTVRDFHRRGHRKLVVKARAVKKGLWKLDFPDDEDLAADHVNDELGWSTVHHEGRPGAFLVQEHIPMTYEYRIFVISHVPVSGAGCIEEFVPLDRTATDAFDAQMRKDREQQDPVTDQVAVARLYEDFVKHVTQRVREERPDMRHYVVDLALDAHGCPVIVEFNGLRNAGFYANDVDQIIDRFYEQEPTRIDQLIPDPLAELLGKKSV